METRPHSAPCRGNRHPERDNFDTLPSSGDLSESTVSWLELQSPVSRGLQRPRTDRSEIGPYLGSHWATSQSPTTNPALSANLRGMAISPKAPTSADTDRRRAGPLGDRSLPRRSLGYIPESYYKPSPIRKPPRHGDFSQSANVRRHGPPQGQTARRSVPTMDLDGSICIPSLSRCHPLGVNDLIPLRHAHPTGRQKF